MKKAFLNPTTLAWVPPQQRIYCRYWVNYGMCDYTHSQYGCRYKHEMPTDIETLGTLGLREIPQWYQQTKAAEIVHSVTAEQAAPPSENSETSHHDCTSVSGSETSEQSAGATPTTCSSPPLGESSNTTPPVSPCTEVSEGEQELAFPAIKEDSMESTSSSTIDLEELPLKGDIEQPMLAKDHGRSLDKDYEESMGLTPDKTGPPVDIDNEDVDYHCQKCFDTLYSMRQVHQHVAVRGHFVRHGGLTYGEVPRYDSKGLETYTPLEPTPVSRLNVYRTTLLSKGIKPDRTNCESPSPAPVYRRLFETEDSASPPAVTEAPPTVLHNKVVPVEAESPPELPPQDARTSCTMISSSLTSSVLQDTGICPQCKKQGKTYHHRRWDCIAWMGTKDGQVYAAERRDRRESRSRSSVSRGRTASAQPLQALSSSNSQTSSETLVSSISSADECNDDHSTTADLPTSTALSETLQSPSWTTIAPRGPKWKSYSKPLCNVCKKTNHSDSQCWFRHPEQAPERWTQGAAEYNMAHPPSVQINEPVANFETVPAEEKKRRQRMGVCVKCMEALHGGIGRCPNGWRFQPMSDSTAGVGRSKTAGKIMEVNKKPEENLISFADEW